MWNTQEIIFIEMKEKFMILGGLMLLTIKFAMLNIQNVNIKYVNTKIKYSEKYIIVCFY